MSATSLTSFAKKNRLVWKHTKRRLFVYRLHSTNW